MAVYKNLTAGLHALVMQAKGRTSRKIGDEIAEYMANIAVTTIIRRTRQGLGVSKSFGTMKQLKPLSPAYVDFRRHNRRRLSAFTTATKSNLTFTGELMHSIGHKKRKDGQYVVICIGERSTGKSNAQIARYVSKQRPFLHLSREEADQILISGRRKFNQLAK